MKTKPLIQPHLVINEVRLPKGGEWLHQFRGWCLAHIVSGISYWQEQNGMREIAAGSTLVFPAEAERVLRASRLNEVVIVYFCVDTGKLHGLLNLREQRFLKEAAEQKNSAPRVSSPASPISDRFRNLRPSPETSPSSTRLRLLQLFFDVFDWETNQDPTANLSWTDGRKRFREMLNKMAVSEFVELSVSELAPMMSCTPRHFNRLFREELGSSFREKQIELRLAKACELLTTSNAKVIDVALESGYQSSSVFSQLFKKHLGVSPGRWRRQRLNSGVDQRLHF
jgi:AraC-like DNA-binding protein